MEPVYQINDYIWSKSDFRDFFTTQQYKPIFPVQTQPEAELPYLRYTTRTARDRPDWWMVTYDVTYAIYHDKIPESADISNWLDAEFRRQDESAYDLNRWIRINSEPLVKWHSSEVISMLSPEPPTQEGGRHSRLITIRFRYSDIEGKGVG
jgi:hypothetical protein